MRKEYDFSNSRPNKYAKKYAVGTNIVVNKNMGFPANMAEKTLLDCGRHCCICHKFCGFKIELHHIIPRAEGGEDTYDNCIPLCLDCHAEVRAYDPKHPKGRKYTVTELKGHRDRWYEKVVNSHGITSSPDYIEIDRKLFLEIRSILSSTNSIEFIRSHDYAAHFDPDKHEDLYVYRNNCKRPEFEFLDIELEGFRVQLLNTIEGFWDLLGEHCFSVEKNPDLYCIRPAISPERFLSMKSMGVSEKEIHERVSRIDKLRYEVIAKLHDSANKICETYDTLIRLGRRKLTV